jgi:hypothetical protein
MAYDIKMQVSENCDDATIRYSAQKMFFEKAGTHQYERINSSMKWEEVK